MHEAISKVLQKRWFLLVGLVKLVRKNSACSLYSQAQLKTRRNLLKAMDKLASYNEDELFYTAPMALSVDMIIKIRKELINFIEKLREEVVVSNSEALACLNIDWFKF